MKVLTLLVQYNGLASILLGTFAAFVMLLLFSLGHLPIYERPSYNGEEGASLWSLAVGLLVSIVSFTSWKSRQQVFLDRICINHEDADMKTEAIFSLAGMLKASKELLVLWDTSWSDRLWCLFEMAAFLKSKNAENSRRVLIIRPTTVGPCSIAALLTTWSSMFGLSMFPLSGFGALLLAMSGFWAIVAFRGYFSAVEILEEKLNCTSFDSVRSACCDTQHVDEHGNQLLCDREVLNQCVAIWFGSTQAFEDFLRTEVSQTVVRDLRENVFTTTWALQVTSPILWTFMDFMAAHAREGQWLPLFDKFVLGLVSWLLCATNINEFFLFLTRRYCRASWGGPLPDFFLKLALLLVLCLALWFHLGIYLLIYERVQNLVVRPLAFAGSMLLIYFMARAFKRTFATGATGGKGARVDASEQCPTEPHGSSTFIGRSQM